MTTTQKNITQRDILLLPAPLKASLSLLLTCVLFLCSILGLIVTARPREVVAKNLIIVRVKCSTAVELLFIVVVVQQLIAISWGSFQFRKLVLTRAKEWLSLVQFGGPTFNLFCIDKIRYLADNFGKNALSRSCLS